MKKLLLALAPLLLVGCSQQPAPTVDSLVIEFGNVKVKDKYNGFSEKVLSSNPVREVKLIDETLTFTENVDGDLIPMSYGLGMFGSPMEALLIRHDGLTLKSSINKNFEDIISSNLIKDAEISDGVLTFTEYIHGRPTTREIDLTSIDLTALDLN